MNNMNVAKYVTLRLVIKWNLTDDGIIRINAVANGNAIADLFNPTKKVIANHKKEIIYINIEFFI